MRLRLLLKACLAVLALLLVLAAPSLAAPQPQSARRSCGTVRGTPITAHGVSCQKARQVYRAYLRSRAPRGWVCSFARHRCYRGHIGSAHFVSWPPGVYGKLALE